MQRQAAQFGQEVRDPILEKLDKIEPWMSFYFQAKAELNTCAGMNGQIPWTAIRDYAETYGLDVDQFDDFCRVIRAMEDGVRQAQEENKAQPQDDQKAE